MDTCYDNIGRVLNTTYPYQGGGNLPSTQSCLSAGDTFSYDALSRITQVLHSDNSAISTTFTEAAVSVSDEGNGTRSVQRVSQMDGLGRITSVCEVTNATLPVGTDQPSACGTDIAANGFKTSYSYDALGSIKLGTQGTQTRS